MEMLIHSTQWNEGTAEVLAELFLLDEYKNVEFITNFVSLICRHFMQSSVYINCKQ